MAVLWAAGTVNYGTATRHHMVHQWIVLLLGVPALVQMVPGAQPQWPAATGSRSAPNPPSPAGPRPAHPHLRRLGGAMPAKPRPLAVAPNQPQGFKP
jgi:hypothetical protein